MSDFNLAAAITLQLATGAGAKLAAEINSHLGSIKDVSPNIKPVLVLSAEAKKLFNSSAKKPTSVNVKVNITNNTALTDLLKDKKINIDVEFSDKAKKAIDDFSTSLSKLRESAKGFEELQKLVKYMNTIGKADFESLTGGGKADAASKTKAKAEKAKAAYEDLVSTIASLGKKAGKGEFVPFAIKTFEQLQTKFKTTSNLASRFSGVTGQTFKNTKFAIESVFSAFRDINREQARASKSGLLQVDPNLQKQFEKAKVEALKVLQTLDSAEQIPLASAIKDVVKPMRDLVSEATKYRRLISDINKEGIEAKATGASPEVIKSIKERLKLAKDARKSGVSVSSFKESDPYQDSLAQGKNFTNIQRTALRAATSVEKFREELRIYNSELNSEGAVATKAKDRITALVDGFESVYKAQAKTGGTKAVEEITNGMNSLKISVSKVMDETKDFDAVLKSLNDKKAFFDARGLKESAALTEKQKNALIQAQKLGTNGPINTSSGVFQAANQGIESFAENEKKINKFILAIDRLKASLQFSLGGGQDFTDVGSKLTALEKKMSDSINNFDERKVRDTLTGDSYKIRAKDKLNKVINTSISSFQDAAFESSSAGKGISKLGPVAFSDAQKQLESYVSTLNVTSDSYADIGKNIDLVKNKADKLFALATIKSEGGFIGAISKSLGLAAKRLTTFLFAARAIYGVQNAIIDATASAVELDTEFTKLEQIFAGSAGGADTAKKSVESLSTQVLTLAKNYGLAATEIAKSADIFAQAGIQGRSLEKVLDISARARLGPTFGSNIEISEAIIASMNQFRLKADDMENVIGGISQVAAQFAVESDGITKAIRRAGGAFAAAKADGQSYLSSLGDFVGAFTVLKEQTREADETLATSLRNVLNRLQRSSVRKYLQENFQIDLLDQENQFIGFAASISKISNKIKDLNIKSGDPRFSELVQKLAGSLQSSRLTSLLRGAGDIEKAVAEFNRGGASLDRDAEIAFGSLENKLGRAKAAVVELFTTLARSDALKAAVELFVVLTQSVTGAVNALSQMGGILGGVLKGLLLYKAAASAASILPQVALKGLAGLSQSGILGPGRGLNTGGLVPGIGPNKDTEPYMLTKGEYVINRNSVSKYGRAFFNDLNSGKINYAATGSGPNGLLSGGGISGLSSYLKEIGVVVAEQLLSQIVSSVDVIKGNFSVGGGAPDSGNRGKYNSKNKKLSISGALSGNDLEDVLLHELVHGLEKKVKQAVGDLKFDQALEQIPDSIKQKTINRAKSRPDVYGEEGSEKYKKKIKREIFADAGSAALTGRGGAGLEPIKQLLKSVGVERRVDVDNRIAANNIPIRDSSDVIRAIRNQGPAPREIQGPPNRFNGGSQPSSSGFSGGGASGGIISKLLSNFGAMAALTTLAGTGLAYFANSSKDASEKVKAFTDAAIAAISAVATYTAITNLASSALAKKTTGDVIGNVIDKTKGFGGGGFFDKYGVNGNTSAKSVAGRIGPAIDGKLGSIIGNVGGKLSTAMPSFAKLGGYVGNIAKLMGPQVLGAALVGATSALRSFTESQIAASEKIIANSTDEREVAQERAKIDKLKSSSSGLGAAGKIGGGALAGAALGSVVPVIGTAVGAVAGGLTGLVATFVTDLKSSNTGGLVADFLKGAKEWIGAFFSVIGNSIGYITGKIDSAVGFIAKKVGLGKSVEEQEKSRALQGNLDKAGANTNALNKGLKRRGGIYKSDFDAAQRAIVQTSAATTGYSSLNEEDQGKVKAQAENLKGALDNANEFQRSKIIDAAQKSGINIAEMFKTVGIEFDIVATNSKIAADKLSKMFAEMASVSERSQNLISNLNIGTESITNRAAGIAGEGTTGGVSSGLFDVLRKGGATNGAATVEANKLFKDLESFSPAAALNAKVEAGGARAASDIKNKVANSNIQIDPSKGGDQLAVTLGDMFDKATQGQSPEVRKRMEDMFDKYLASQEEALNGAVAGGQLDTEKVTGVIDGFTESIKRGGLDTAEAFNGANAQFKQAMDGIIKRRIEYESKITDLAKANVDRQKDLIEFRNKAAGKVDPAINLQQARGLDAQRQGILLRGTGLGGNASVADIRGRYDQLTASDPQGKDPATQALKDNLLKALQETASGTDSLTTAMREFDKASEKAKRRTEELSNALLGTDENLFNTLKGISLQQRVLGAGDKTQAFLALQNSDDTSRQALQQRLGSDPELKREFETKLGISSNISASREAQNVEGEIGKQVGAGNALISINQNLADQMSGLAGEMIKNRESFNTFGLQINNFANAANNLANNLGNIPQNIAHAHTFKVDPIQVTFTGAEALASLDGPFKNTINEIVNSKLASFAESLKANNKGLTVSALTGNTATA